MIADLDFVLTAERHPDNAPYIGQWRKERHICAIASDDEAHFIIERTAIKQAAIEHANQPISVGQPIGYIICQGLQNDNDAVLLLRIVITEKGKGYGRQALEWVKSYAFDTIGTHRLWFDVIASNKRARALYTSAGFQEEGLLRDAWKTTAGYESMLILSMLASEYPSHSAH